MMSSKVTNYRCQPGAGTITPRVGTRANPLQTLIHVQYRLGTH